MRIAYLINQYPSVSHTFIRREIEALEALGVEVARFSARHIEDDQLPDPRDREENQKTFPLLSTNPMQLATAAVRVAASRPVQYARAAQLATHIGLRSDRGFATNQAYLVEACLLLEQLEARHIQHVHAHFGTNAAAVAMLVHELGGPGYSFTVHGPEEFDKPELISLRDKIQRARFVVGVSSFGRSQLYRYCPLEAWNKVHVVRCGVGSDYLARAPTPVPDVPKLVNIGRLTEQKGQLLLVEAAGILRQEGRKFELVLIGDGPLRSRIEAAIADLQLQECVRISGWLSGDAVHDEVASGRALVMSSFAEGLPVAIMEALGVGRPVITTQIAGIPELVSTGECGFLVPAGSVTALADAMRTTLDTDVETLSKMGRCGYERVCEMHDVQKNAAELKRLFEQYMAAERVH